MSIATVAAGVTPGRSFLNVPAVFGHELPGLCSRVASHDVELKGEDGRVLFTQSGVLAPRTWSPRAVQIAASKYFFGDPRRFQVPPWEGGREQDVFQLHQRVARFIAQKGVDAGYLDAGEPADRFRRELLGLTLGQFAAFNSPVWFNVGVSTYGVEGDDRAYAWVEDDNWSCGGMAVTRSGVEAIRDTYARPQGSACFIQSVKDDLRSIMRLATQEAMLFKYGSGSGTDLSTIRSKRERLSGGGTPSGPVSFMRVYDTIASVIKSGGKTRRAAKMQTLHVGHGDIFEFIGCKGVEEDKALALIRQGYESNFNGEAYGSVMFQNANLSVRVPDEFMRLLEAGGPDRPSHPWPLRAVTTGEVIHRTTVEEVWASIARQTWRCGDPGVQFSDTINGWHTTPLGLDGGETPINSSNPCSEYLSVDDSACNLASLNLMKFVRGDGTFDVPLFQAAIRVTILAQEILVDACSYPTRKIAQNAHDYRQLGLGFANLGGLIQSQGLAYDSEEARQVAGAISSILGGTAYLTSAEIARSQGAFAAFDINREAMLGCIDRHAGCARGLLERTMDPTRGHQPRSVLGGQVHDLASAGVKVWEQARWEGYRVGYRHAQVTVIAPTGTIAFMMDCDTTGIEPNLALVARKTLAGGGTMTVANRLIGMALDAREYDDEARQRIEAYIAAHGTAERCPDLDPDDEAVFDTSFAPPGFSRVIDWRAHLLMMAEVQRFISGAISKTVNVPSDFTPEEIADVYREAWRLGLKCVAVYRDGSKGSQPLEAIGGPKTPEKGRCHHCGHDVLQQAGTCAICPSCGTPQGGCG